jgi:hypothetical protein
MEGEALLTIGAAEIPVLTRLRRVQSGGLAAEGRSKCESSFELASTRYFPSFLPFAVQVRQTRFQITKDQLTTLHLLHKHVVVRYLLSNYKV